MTSRTPPGAPRRQQQPLRARGPSSMPSSRSSSARGSPPSARRACGRGTAAPRSGVDAPSSRGATRPRRGRRRGPRPRRRCSATPATPIASVRPIPAASRRRSAAHAVEQPGGERAGERRGQDPARPRARRRTSLRPRCRRTTASAIVEAQRPVTEATRAIATRRSCGFPETTASAASACRLRLERLAARPHACRCVATRRDPRDRGRPRAEIRYISDTGPSPFRNTAARAPGRPPGRCGSTH